MPHEFYDEFFKDIGKLLESGTNSDVIIQAGEGDTFKEFRVHSLILSARSPYFQAAFSSNWVKKENSFIIFKKPNISADTFKIILEYLYKATIDFSKLDGSEILQLLVASDEFNFLALTEEIRSFLIQKRAELLRRNPVDLLRMILQHEAFATLREYFIQTIREDFEIIEKDPGGILRIILQYESATLRDSFVRTISGDIRFIRKDLSNLLQISSKNKACATLKDLCIKTCCFDGNNFFESPPSLNLDRSLLIEILKQEFSNAEEVQIWNYLLKWGVARSSNLDIKNKDKWTIREFKKLKRILEGLIQLIRWFQIPAAYFRKELILLKSILPEDLFLDVMGYHLDPNLPPSTFVLPPRSPMDNSLIVNHCLLKQVTDQINQCNKKNPTGHLKLLYRASRDGFEVGKFHSLCDDKGATIITIKCRELNKTIGGYNPISWDSTNTWKNTTESFLFIYDNSCLSVFYPNPSRSTSAICCSTSYGPYFGDFYLSDNNANFNHSSIYPNFREFLGNFSQFALQDYEVFQLLPVTKF